MYFQIQLLIRRLTIIDDHLFIIAHTCVYKTMPMTAKKELDTPKIMVINAFLFICSSFTINHLFQPRVRKQMILGMLEMLQYFFEAEYYHPGDIDPTSIKRYRR